MRHRLVDRLRTTHAIDEHTLTRVVRDCRATGRPLGETLVAQGGVTLEALRETLLEHTAEALLQLAASPEAEWRAMERERYDQRLTFSPLELLAHSADSWLGPLASRTRSRLTAALSGRPVSGASFLNVPGSPDSVIPVAFVNLEGMKPRDLLRIGRAAALAMNGAAALGGRIMAMIGADGQTTLVWADEGMYYVAFGEERSELAYLLGHLSRQDAD
jgi:hypothetical protein